MSIFEIIGPVMIGPSSSHTAGAVRLGRMARYLLGVEPIRAHFTLTGSFAATGEGHGTLDGLLGGVLGLDPDDPSIVNSPAVARERGIEAVFSTDEAWSEHPNTVRMTLEGREGGKLEVAGSSIGGGKIRLLTLDGLRVDHDIELSTLIAVYPDRPGVAAAITRILAGYHTNIAAMKVNRRERGKTALMLLETDEPIPDSALEAVQRLPWMEWVRYVPPIK